MGNQQMPLGWGNRLSAHFVFILCFILLFAVFFAVFLPGNSLSLFQLHFVIFNFPLNTNVGKVISESYYLLLENTRHSAGCQGPAAKYNRKAYLIHSALTYVEPSADSTPQKKFNTLRTLRKQMSHRAKSLSFLFYFHSDGTRCCAKYWVFNFIDLIFQN